MESFYDFFLNSLRDRKELINRQYNIYRYCYSITIKLFTFVIETYVFDIFNIFMLDKEERKIERLIITVFFSYKEQLRSNVNDREKLKLCDESYNDNHSIG